MTNKEQNTALHETVMSGSLDVVKLLMETASDFPYSANGSGETPLYLAAARGFKQIVDEILEKSPSPTHQGPNGLTALHAAVKANSTDLLVTNPLLKNIINEKDVKGNTPLHVLAALCGHSSYDIVYWNYKVYYQVVNKQNISAANIVDYGYPELEREIQELGKDDGSGQYPGGLVKIKKQKYLKMPSFWERLDEETIGIKEAIEYHLVVAALIATVTFAAAFTVPGGYRAEEGPKQGTAILSRNVAFQAFVIADAIAMVLSLSAVFVHFIMSLKAFKKFIYLFALAMLFTVTAMGAMVVAFVTGTYAMLAPSLKLASTTCIIGLSFFLLVFLMMYNVLSKSINEED